MNRKIVSFHLNDSVMKTCFLPFWVDRAQNYDMMMSDVTFLPWRKENMVVVNHFKARHLTIKRGGKTTRYQLLWGFGNNIPAPTILGALFVIFAPNLWHLNIT